VGGMRMARWMGRVVGWALLLAPAVAVGESSPLRVGGDLSALGVVEQQGGTFLGPDGKAVDLLSSLAERGWNTYRLRLFVHPEPKAGIRAGDLEGTLALARRIRTSGSRLLLDLHYSDTWADPAHQQRPRAWAELSYPELLLRVEAYSASVMRAFQEAGLTPDYVQAGNEIGQGVLWPHGRLGGGDPDAARDRLAELLKAAVRGLRAPFPESERVPVVLHVHSGASWSATGDFFRSLEARGVSYDILGLSYYPWWHGSMAGLRENLRNCAETFGKPVWVVETAYPYRETRWFADQPNLDWPLTPAGQRQFLRDVTAAVRQLPDQSGLGVLWWHPESIPAGSLKPWMRGSCALFDPDGRPLPALEVWDP